MNAMSSNSIQLRLINIGLLLAFSIGYLEWGGGNSSFIFQAELVIFNKTDNLLTTLLHPIVLLGFIGQFLLIFSAFRKAPNKMVNIIGIILTGVIIVFIFLAGLLSANFKMVVSAIPYLVLSFLYFRYYRKKAKMLE